MRNSILLMLAMCAAFSAPVMALEEPAFEVVASKNGIEYRQYQPYLVAETLVTAEASRDEAANIGFRRLFKYISGDNEVQSEIAKSAVISQQPVSTKIAMTAPVRQIPQNEGWSIAFIVPGEFDQTSVPRPTDPEVNIRTVPGELMAVLRYSGRWTDANADNHKAQLLGEVNAAGLIPLGEVVTAFYNSPFSLPFMRRNEVMVAVNQVPPS